MSDMTISTDYHTTKAAAKRIGVTDARIRQMCIANDIGQKAGRDWLLSESDLTQLEKLPRKNRK